MKICVLQPDYSTSNVDYKNYDPPRDLSRLLPDDQVDHVFLNKLTTYKQLKQLSRQGYDVFVNLCEAYLEWEVPSIDVIHSLDLLNLPYTGPTAELYDPPKEIMKYVAHLTGIDVPNFRIVRELDDLNDLSDQLRFPLFVKPSKAGDSLGVDEASLVTDEKSLLVKVRSLLEEYGEVLVEEYIDGREFTVLVCADPKDEKKCTSFKPVEYLFPNGFRFKTYALKTSELHPESNIGCREESIERKLRKAACAIFKEFGGKGYARLDFRMNPKGKLYFLEINFTCSVFYPQGYEGSADHILKLDGAGQASFLKQIIQEGISRHRRKMKKYYVKKNAISGYGIYAQVKVRKGEVVFRGEEKNQRLVTKSFVEKNWNAADKEVFRKYAYPVGTDVYILWDTNPEEWAPQNHSCDPNTHYQGLNVIASRDIAKHEELTLDYYQ
ncbi:MAG TPA: SET domain-containing protein-lysine N-methyltransferase, partial [Saprospiraceae bacterium]|nr:SET domain-containing protein-lysine N-methyltransferase [Saprospiraceae bacterium]